MILQTYGISYTSSRKYFDNNPELMSIVGINMIPEFRILSYRRVRKEWLDIKGGIIDLIESDEENVSTVRFIMHAIILMRRED